MKQAYSTASASSGRRRRTIGAIVTLVLAVLLAACGGSVSPTRVPSLTPLPTTMTVIAVPSVTSAPAVSQPTPAVPTPPPAAQATPGLPAAPSAAPTVTPPPAVATAPSTATPLPRAGQPTRLRIPVIRVDAAIEYVGLTPAGAMDIPQAYANTAWYEPGTRPGDQGNAAIAGHVDSKTGPAVFWDLPKLAVGDEIFVVGDDGNERRFVVTGRESYQRTDAPLERIFGSTTARQLNLITCDPRSTFDREKGEYASNVVVYAELAP